MEGKGKDCYYCAKGYSWEGDRRYSLNISKIIESSTGSNDEEIEFELVHESVFISPLGDPGLMCLVCSVAGDFVIPRTVVVVFSVSSSSDGKHLTAAVVAKHVVQTMQLTVSGVDPDLEPAFVICESLKKRTAQPSSDVVSKRGKLHCFLDQSGVGGLG